MSFTTCVGIGYRLQVFFPDERIWSSKEAIYALR